MRDYYDGVPDFSPLIAAAEFHEVEIAEMYIAAGADINAQVNGVTALGAAVENSYFPAVRLLRKYNAI